MCANTATGSSTAVRPLTVTFADRLRSSPPEVSPVVRRSSRRAFCSRTATTPNRPLPDVVIPVIG